MIILNQIKMADLTTRSFIAAFSSLATIVLMGLPMIRRHYGFMAQSQMLYLIAVFLTLFITQAVIDLVLKSPNKGCHLFDSMLVALSGLIGFGIYEATKYIPLIGSFIRNQNMYVDLVISGIFVAISVFIYKRGFRMLIIGNMC